MPNIKTPHGPDMTVAEYLRRRDIIRDTPFIIKSTGEGIYLYKGQEYSSQKFKRMFPLPISLVMYSSRGADRSKDWLTNLD